MSHPPPHTSAHENDLTLETKTSTTTNQMKTVIKNSAQDPCLPLSLTPRFLSRKLSEQLVVGQMQRRTSNPTESESIRLNPSNLLPDVARSGRRSLPQSKIEILNSKICPKPLKFHFIALSYTFFLKPKVKPDKETACSPKCVWRKRVKFLALFDHQ